MAKSRFEYVRKYELPDILTPNTVLIVRVDGRGFHRFSEAHHFEKPNDAGALELMNHAAKCVMEELPDAVMAFGESDEFSFLIRKEATLYNRRSSKIISTIVSIFTSAYVFHWSTYMPTVPLQSPPTFDGRVVVYPGSKEIRDYFAWRQADTHINNLYNTAFWALVKGGASTTEANKTLQGTDSKDKNELLFSRFGINYNTLPQMFRKGSVLVRKPVEAKGLSGMGLDTESDEVGNARQDASGGRPKGRRKEANDSLKLGEIEVLHEDIIGDAFWSNRPWLLA